MTDLADTTDQPTGGDTASPQMPDSSKPALPAAPDGSTPDTTTAPDAAARPADPTAAQASSSAATDPQPASPFAATAEAPQPPDLAARLAAVQQIADPHLRQATEANIRLLTQREINAFSDQQRNAKAQAKAIIDQGGGLTAIPAKLILAIDQPGRQALQNYALAHGNPRTDPVTYYGLKNQALDDPAGFQAIDLTNHMAELDARDYADLTKLQNDLRSGQLPADFSLQQVYKLQTDRLLQQLDQQDKATGSIPRGSAAGDPQAAAAFRRAVDLQLAAHHVAYGRVATPAEQQQILARMLDQRRTTASAGSYPHDATSQPVPSTGQPSGDQQMADMTTAQPMTGPQKEESPSAQGAPDDSAEARKRDILAGGGGRFIVADNPKANENWPLREAPEDGRVLTYSKEIEAAAKETGVDPDLIRAIMYMETSHGGYDKVFDAMGINKSILPMNVNVDYWGDHFGTREELHDPYLNVLAGARMLQAIVNNVPPGTSIAKIASLYNTHKARVVSDYGARVAKIYREKLWEHPPAPRWPRIPQFTKQPVR